MLLGIAYIRWRPPLRQTLVFVALGLAVAVAGLAVAGVFTSGVIRRRLPRTAGPSDGSSDTAFNLRQFLSYVWQFYLPKLEFMQPAIGVPGYGFREVYIQSFYSDFAWLEIGYPALRARPAPGGDDVAAVGLYTVAVTRLDAVRRNWPTLAFLVFTGLSMVAVLHVTSYTAMLSNPGDPVFTGRYLFPLLSLLAIAVTVVVAALPRRIGAFASGALVATGITLPAIRTGDGAREVLCVARSGPRAPGPASASDSGC